MNFGRDPDDWFEGTDTEERPAAGRRRERDAQEDWLQDAGAPRQPWLERIDRRILVLAVVGVALLIAVLAAAGVFSSSSPAPVAAVTAVTDTTTTTQPATTPAAQALPAPTTTLKPGDTGAQVTALQRALASLGFSTGKVDGQYGPATETAVKGFQRSVKLTPDGIVGPATLAKLTAALHGA
jgi:hypothetical protein